MNAFCHLHAHSCFSWLEGLPAPEELVAAAVKAEMPALALTDHRSLSGVPAFLRACRSAGIQPLVGLEIDLLLPGRSRLHAPPMTGALVLLACSAAGWRNLCRLSSALLNPPEESALPVVTLDFLSAHAGDLLCLTGGCRGVLAGMMRTPDDLHAAQQWLGTMQDVFGDRLYYEAHRQGSHTEAELALEEHLLKKTSISAVASHAVYYLEPRQQAAQRLAAAVRTNLPLTALSPDDVAPPDAWFLTTAAMQERFAAASLLAASTEITSRCNWQFQPHQRNYPEIPLPPGVSADALLRQKAIEGANRLYPQITGDITRRLAHELDTIAERGYATLFLIAQEMIAFAHTRGIPYASRGSASSSLVAHCLGITSPDPVALDLYFERFLNPARSTPPDIDTDFCSRRRDEVIQHLFQTYGAERVAMVGSVNTFRPRSAFQAAAKAFGFAAEEMRPLSRRLPWFYRPGADDDPSESPFAELQQEFRREPRYRELFSAAQGLLGRPHHLSVHPGGVVIAPGPLIDTVPVAHAAGKGITITQFDMTDVEEFGLIKLDLLGIRGLTVLGDVVETLYNWRRAEFRTPAQVFDQIPPVDERVSDLISNGRTIGCFQIESPGMRATLREIQAQSPADLMAALALYRPGPLKGGLRDAFVRRHNRQEAVTHIHPALSQLLAETYGVILYQEQVLRIAHELAGMSLTEADLLRRAMSHFDPGKQMQVLRDSFITGAQTNSGIPTATGERIWEMMAAFAGYGFPKAHAASYAQVSWRSAWCKTYYPAEFLASVLANHGGYYPQSVYLNEVRRSGFRVYPPHINHSRSQFCVEYPDGEPVLCMGLDQVHELTHRTQQRIQRLRPFTSLEDFLLRVDPRPLEAARLIEVGALEGFGAIPAMLRQINSPRKAGQLSLFTLSEPPAQEDWTVEQKALAQLRWLGVSLALHPLETLQPQIDRLAAISILDAAGKIGKHVRVAGVRQSSQRSFAQHTQGWVILTLEDQEGMLEVLLSPQLYRTVRTAIAGSGQPLMAEGTMERDPVTGEPVLRASTMVRLG